jgi:hypothetical protein
VEVNPRSRFPAPPWLSLPSPPPSLFPLHAFSLHNTRSVEAAALHIALGDRHPLDVGRVDAIDGEPGCFYVVWVLEVWVCGVSGLGAFLVLMWGFLWQGDCHPLDVGRVDARDCAHP